MQSLSGQRMRCHGDLHDTGDDGHAEDEGQSAELERIQRWPHEYRGVGGGDQVATTEKARADAKKDGGEADGQHRQRDHVEELPSRQACFPGDDQWENQRDGDDCDMLNRGNHKNRRRRRLVEARSIVRKRLALAWKCQNLFCALGKRLKRLGRYEEAEASLAQAVTLDSTFALAQMELFDVRSMVLVLNAQPFVGLTEIVDRAMRW